MQYISDIHYLFSVFCGSTAPVRHKTTRSTKTSLVVPPPPGALTLRIKPALSSFSLVAALPRAFVNISHDLTPETRLKEMVSRSKIHPTKTTFLLVGAANN
jgi:hypothetical protein